jgi:DNA-directed RNA polymerase subunit RPC12/RpoP
VLPKHFYVLQYFPDLVNLESSEYEAVYGMECEYCSSRFLVRVVVKINFFFYIQGVLIAAIDPENGRKLMEFGITCMTALLEKAEQ